MKNLCVAALAALLVIIVPSMILADEGRDVSQTHQVYIFGQYFSVTTYKNASPSRLTKVVLGQRVVWEAVFCGKHTAAIRAAEEISVLGSSKTEREKFFDKMVKAEAVFGCRITAIEVVVNGRLDYEIMNREGVTLRIIVVSPILTRRYAATLYAVSALPADLPIIAMTYEEGDGQ